MPGRTRKSEQTEAEKDKETVKILLAEYSEWLEETGNLTGIDDHDALADKFIEAYGG